MKREKPKFYRQDWHKKKKIGRKKKLKWRFPQGGDSKIRLSRAGKSRKVKIGWRSDKKIRNKINGHEVTRIENMTQLENMKKGQGIMIAHVGKKKRLELVSKANEKGLIILNRWRKNESK